LTLQKESQEELVIKIDFTGKDFWLVLLSVYIKSIA